MTDLNVVVLTAGALRDYGRVLDATEAGLAPPLATERALEPVRSEFGPELDSRFFDLPTGEPTVSKLEIHHRTPQLTMTFDADWILALLVTDQDPTQAVASDLEAYRVPARTPVLLGQGVWHSPIAVVGPSRAVVTFTAVAVEQSDVVELAIPVGLSAA